ncbi:hypothetical protein OCU04_010465 [Sclerotinia nivalis]|uniref:Uncharacterized protein n=1 Tax=Sclerotinia nivalis TaxID=352851 RepID=A0A9X0AEL5_9HELO|nr:hypothetical protein OCU04_010465 [Sclerotinia nivalis]
MIDLLQLEESIEDVYREYQVLISSIFDKNYKLIRDFLKKHFFFCQSWYDLDWATRRDTFQKAECNNDFYWRDLAKINSRAAVLQSGTILRFNGSSGTYRSTLVLVSYLTIAPDDQEMEDGSFYESLWHSLQNQIVLLELNEFNREGLYIPRFSILNVNFVSPGSIFMVLLGSLLWSSIVVK